MCPILGVGPGKGEEQDRHKPDVKEPIILWGNNPYRVIK